MSFMNDMKPFSLLLAVPKAGIVQLHVQSFCTLFYNKCEQYVVLDYALAPSALF